LLPDEMGMKHVRLVMIAAIVACAAALGAQAGSDLAGTWTIERGAAPAGRGAGGIAGIPIANTIIIKLSPSDVTMETDTGSGQSMQSFVYKLDGSSNPVPGALGWETKATAAWQGTSLVVMTRRSMTGPTGPMGVDVKDVYSVAGDILTIDRSMGRVTQKLIYKKGAFK
jgi:hypothetical protein